MRYIRIFAWSSNPLATRRSCLSAAPQHGAELDNLRKTASGSLAGMVGNRCAVRRAASKSAKATLTVGRRLKLSVPHEHGTVTDMAWLQLIKSSI
jgi:hypothetical protein